MQERFPGYEYDTPPWAKFSFRDEGRSYAITSLVSQDHADKLAVEYRQAWLREKSKVS